MNFPTDRFPDLRTFIFRHLAIRCGNYIGDDTIVTNVVLTSLSQILFGASLSQLFSGIDKGHSAAIWWHALSGNLVARAFTNETFTDYSLVLGAWCFGVGLTGTYWDLLGLTGTYWDFWCFGMGF